jgi:CheY-like chemotaxis protein
MLRSEPYAVHTAESGSAALALIAERRFDVIVSDQRMPAMTGVELLQQVRERSPATVRVILSGYADVNVIVSAINDGGIYRFLPKPWDDEELRATIRQCVEYGQSLQTRGRLEQELAAAHAEITRLRVEAAADRPGSPVDELPIVVLDGDGGLASVAPAADKHVGDIEQWRQQVAEVLAACQPGGPAICWPVGDQQWQIWQRRDGGYIALCASASASGTPPDD